MRKSLRRLRLMGKLGKLFCMNWILFLIPLYLSALSVLTEEQVAQFEQDGFLVLPGFINEADCDTLKAHVEEMVESFDPSDITVFDTVNHPQTSQSYFLESGGKIHYFFEAGAIKEGNLIVPKERAINKMGHAMHDLDPLFNSFSRQDKIKWLSEDLGYGDALLIQSMYIFKQPFIGGEVTCHQDGTFIISEPEPALGYWIAIEDANLGNGCLWAIPGGHIDPLKMLFLRDEKGTSFAYFDKTPWDLSKMIPLEAKKGTLIVLHGRSPHMSYTNKSAKSRHAFTLHIVKKGATFPENNWLQREEPFKGF